MIPTTVFLAVALLALAAGALLHALWARRGAAVPAREAAAVVEAHAVDAAAARRDADVAKADTTAAAEKLEDPIDFANEREKRRRT